MHLAWHTSAYVRIRTYTSTRRGRAPAFPPCLDLGEGAGIYFLLFHNKPIAEVKGVIFMPTCLFVGVLVVVVERHPRDCKSLRTHCPKTE